MPQPEPFEGVIARTQAESVPWWPVPAHPAEGAPDVVVILLDDLGFSHFGCYGSDLTTPHIDALAAGGLRYSNFHVTPLCSPTRASLLTGRNHHTVGMRAISNFDSGYPHIRGHITDHATTMAEVLRDEGYATFAVGKWHLCAMENASAAGPYDQWPCQRGFDRFYGFLEGETDQFSPDLIYDNHRTEPPAAPDDGYHLSEDLVDHAIAFIHDSVSIRPDRPFFTYLAFGAMHAPHQAPADYLAKYRGRFDEGWDVARERWFARQIELGLLAPDTELAPRNPGVEPWDSLPDNQKRLAARLQEAFAAFLEHTDAQIGRLVADLEQLGRLDNTLLLVLSDNGASQEGGPFGILHEMKYFNMLVETPDEAVERLDDIGGPHSHANYPWGWAQAGNTPFKWYKQNTHEGGVHVPLIVHWPDGVSDAGSVHDQFHHVNDVAPTVYELLGIEPPPTCTGATSSCRGRPSMSYTFDRPDAPTTKRPSTTRCSATGPSSPTGGRPSPGTRRGAVRRRHWELYHYDIDRSECHDLAAAMPDKLAELVALWWEEAEDQGVLPLDDRSIELFFTRYRDNSVHPTDRRYTYYPPMAPLPAQVAPGMGGRGSTWRPPSTVRPGPEGCCSPPAPRTRASASSSRTTGSCSTTTASTTTTWSDPPSTYRSGRPSWACASDARGRATAMLSSTAWRAAPAGAVRHAHHLERRPSIGYDHGSPVSERYTGHFPFEGTLHKVEIAVPQKGHESSGGPEAHQRAAMAQQ